MRPFFLLVCSLLACSHRAAGSAPLPSPPDTAAPFDRVAVVEALGQAISEKDDASASGTDAMFEVSKQQPLPPMMGWITVREAQGWTVRFIRRDLEVPTSALDIRLGGTHPEAVVPPVSGEVLPPEQAAMWRARQLAIRSSPPRCGQGLNPVVLSASLVGQPGWLVYLLTPATASNQVVIGGHVRVHVSQDGREVLDTTPLSRGCLTIEGDGSTTHRTVAAVTTQVEGKVPHETTVSESLRSKKDIFVLTRDGARWKVSAGKVTPL